MSWSLIGQFARVGKVGRSDGTLLRDPRKRVRIVLAQPVATQVGGVGLLVWALDDEGQLSAVDASELRIEDPHNA